MTASPLVASPHPGPRALSDVLSPVRIVVDCMGGDHGPSVTLPAAKSFLEKHPDAEVILVGLPDAIEPARQWPRTTLVPASEVPLQASPRPWPSVLSCAGLNVVGQLSHASPTPSPSVSHFRGSVP